ncbi:MAG: hypothetical protein OEM02_00805 [Desulfobulbaceae bacterium]|nr:hypothetical protein [Desulfobulbaceae bacterium]
MAGLPMVLTTAITGLLHVRHSIFFALLFMCYVPGYLNGTPVGNGIQRLYIKNKNILSVAYVIIGIYFTFFALSNKFWELKIPVESAWHQRGGPVYPVGAVNYLIQHKFRGNLMTPFSVGAFVSWKMYPEVKVSMDSRFEVAYEYELVEENVDFYNGTLSWNEISQRYGTDALLIPNWTRVKSLLNEDSKLWKLVYKDGSYSLYMTKNQAAGYPVTDIGSKTVAGIFP